MLHFREPLLVKRIWKRSVDLSDGKLLVIFVGSMLGRLEGLLLEGNLLGSLLGSLTGMLEGVDEGCADSFDVCRKVGSFEGERQGEGLKLRISEWLL